MSENTLKSILKVVEEVKHENQPRGKKLKHLIESDIKDSIDTVLKMKNGILTTVKLALDHDPNSDVIAEFRLLSAEEEYEILDAMAETGLSPLDTRYRLKFAALTLSKASCPSPNQTFNSPSFSVKTLMAIETMESLLALGLKYQEFKDKYSPKLESLTEEQIDHAIKMIEESESEVKKLDLLNGWSLKATQEVLINSVTKLTNVTRQLEALLIGS